MWTVISNGVSILLYKSQLSVLQYNVDSYQYWNFNFTLQESVVRSHQYAEYKSSPAWKCAEVSFQRENTPKGITHISSVFPVYQFRQIYYQLLVFHNILKE